MLVVSDTLNLFDAKNMASVDELLYETSTLENVCTQTPPWLYSATLQKICVRHVFETFGNISLETLLVK